MAGIRIYFGNHDKTLIRRQREDDPVAHMLRPVLVSSLRPALEASLQARLQGNTISSTSD